MRARMQHKCAVLRAAGKRVAEIRMRSREPSEPTEEQKRERERQIAYQAFLSVHDEENKPH